MANVGQPTSLYSIIYDDSYIIPANHNPIEGINSHNHQLANQGRCDFLPAATVSSMLTVMEVCLSLRHAICH